MSEEPTKQCSNCEGTGTCPVCNGSGSICNDWHWTYEPCPYCDRTGKCSVCNGTGVVPVTPPFIVTKNTPYVQVSLEDHR